MQALTPAELADGTAYLMLLNPTGGLVGGDHLSTQITLEAGTSVCLTRDQPAVQETRIQLGAGASLEYLPDHVIPHANARFHQSQRIEMARGSRAILWDALAAGRVAHGERWTFSEVDLSTEISLRGRAAFHTAEGRAVGPNGHPCPA